MGQDAVLSVTTELALKRDGIGAPSRSRSPASVSQIANRGWSTWRDADRTSIAEAAKKNKVTEQTIYLWRKDLAGLTPSDVKRLKALELESVLAANRLIDDGSSSNLTGTQNLPGTGRALDAL